MHFNGTSSKSMAYHYLIGLNDQGNTREIFQEQQIKEFCLLLDFILTIDLFFNLFFQTIDLFFNLVFHLPMCVQSKYHPRPTSWQVISCILHSETKTLCFVLVWRKQRVPGLMHVTFKIVCHISILRMNLFLCFAFTVFTVHVYACSPKPLASVDHFR